MPYEIKDRLSLKLLFAGVEFPFNRANSLNFLHISASSRIGIPMIHMSLDDNVEFFADQGLLGDGVRIEVIYSNGTSTDSKSLTFRLNSSKKTSAAPATSYEIDGYLDVLSYWHQSALKERKGSSSAVLEAIAKDCDMKFEGETTADSQIWWPGNLKYHAWAKEIAAHSYRGPNSCMQIGVELDKTLLFKDVASQDYGEKHNMVLVNSKKGFITATDFQPIASSGSSNAMHAYKSARVYQPITRPPKDVNTYDDQIEVAPTESERSFLLNEGIRTRLTRGNVRFAPLDFGNNHENYEKAYYQNIRQNSLFTLSCGVVTMEMTKIRLFDVVDLQLDTSAASQLKYQKLYSGPFRVVSRAIYIHANNYYERIELARRAYATETRSD